MMRNGKRNGTREIGREKGKMRVSERKRERERKNSIKEKKELSPWKGKHLRSGIEEKSKRNYSQFLLFRCF